MAILVTGGARYIGSVTVDYLHSRGEKLVAVDNLVRGHRQALDEQVPFYEGDVGDSALLAQSTREHQLESCIHFAALAYVGESVQDPKLYFENNVRQGIALIGFLLQAGVHRFVLSSTRATYGEPEALPIREDFPQCPTSPYGWSKLFLERLLSSYEKAYAMKFVALRYFQCCGRDRTTGRRSRT